MDSIPVQLSTSEISMCAMVGNRRQFEAIRRASKDRDGFVGDGWSEHIEGACAELAFAKWSGLYWGGSVNACGEPDFYPDIDVKLRPAHPSARNLDMYQLNLRTNSKPDCRYIHVVGARGSYLIRGWQHGREVIKREHLRKLDQNRPESYVYPNDLLLPMDSFVIPEVVPLRMRLLAENTSPGK